MNDDCNNKPCLLSHMPTPERVPVCVHFSNGARCNKGSSCKYPHVKLSHKEGICRDFAILGYCDRGLHCDRQHVRECPDFATSGSCPNSRCKLPHIIRAKHNVDDSSVVQPSNLQRDELVETDEFIPLTFDESSEDGSSYSERGENESGDEPT
ncbi:uncharacterized protein EI90DRAFT_3002597 [Cantharellus anzutake]|uniref:uncharacterized protein n=1 Tax=Cantharellus anzutake TaxID=1750568 RepID=UPI001902D499|nr:uncharacterized protein EI90DRAFT_3002597 [Cantharellus anzutake]KAF8317746.1 hypothetical protein EI90DRAFT_3002597 [Cantharellus anzutake]